MPHHLPLGCGQVFSVLTRKSCGFAGPVLKPSWSGRVGINLRDYIGAKLIRIGFWKRNGIRVGVRSRELRFWTLHHPLLCNLNTVVGAYEAEASIRDWRSHIIDKGDLADLTRPIGEPFPDVIQDLWQLTQVTPSYAARAAAGAILLATGIIDNNPVAIVTAAMFLPFLAQVLAISFGVWSLDRRLIQRGLTSLALSAACAFGGGAVVAAIAGGPIQFSSFKSPLTSLAISAAIGITAGLSETDDTGRRYLIRGGCRSSARHLSGMAGRRFHSGVTQL